MSEAKPYNIPKQLVWDAYQRVKANRGAAGVDGESLAAFEQDLKGNLYKVWNRMSSGSYFPPPVRLVEIEKDNGGTRPLGIPTVADRVCQTVAKMVLEPLVEPVFHPDSYGYRPGKSALDAVGMARTRCWATAWVIDLDITSFFDSLDHELVERAVAHHTDIPWVRLYIARWLRAPVQRPDGTLEQRTRGTPQGGVVTPRTQKVTSVDSGLLRADRRRDRSRPAGPMGTGMQWRITIVSSPTSTSLMSKRTRRCRSRMSSVSAATRNRARNAESDSASCRYIVRSRV